MAQIIIRGSPKKIKKHVVREAAFFFCDHLMKRLSKNIKIVIKIRTNMYRNTKCFGTATWTDDNARSNRHREFEIEIEQNLGSVFFIRTLAHELVHVRQYARGQLVDPAYGNYQKWHGVMFNENMVGYKQLPWEQEAIRLEKELYKLWKQQLDK